MASVTAGTAIGWTAPINPKLSHPEWQDTPLPDIASENQLSWIGSLVALGAFISIFILIYILNQSMN